MSEHLKEAPEFSKYQGIIDSLARETETPVDRVKDIYVIEHRKLERVARIKTFVPVLAGREVKRLLNDAHDDDADGVH